MEIGFQKGKVQQVACINEHMGIVYSDRSAIVLKEGLGGCAVDIEF